MLIEKKLREAKFFLDKMIDHERMAFDAKEPFEFYLSAFLSAGRSVAYYVQHQQEAKGWTKETRRKWRQDWEETLPQPQQALVAFMIDTRDVEVHEGGSSHTVGTEDRELGPGVHKFASATHTVAAPPDTPPAIIHVPAYYFTIAGAEQKVTEACTAYLTLLGQMVAHFRNS